MSLVLFMSNVSFISNSIVILILCICCGIVSLSLLQCVYVCDISIFNHHAITDVL